MGSRKKERIARATPEPLEALRDRASEAAGWLKALANPNRLLILCTLVDGELTVGQLNERVPLSQSALSQHLAVLRRDDLVRTRRVSQTIYYALADPSVSRVIALLHDRFCGAGAERTG